MFPYSFIQTYVQKNDVQKEVVNIIFDKNVVSNMKGQPNFHYWSICKVENRADGFFHTMIGNLRDRRVTYK